MNGPSHGENFSLSDFFQARGETLLDRVRPFSDYYRATLAEGRAQYSREITGPAGARVEVLDPATGARRRMIMLGSNNYLGLTTHPRVHAAVVRAVADYGAGMGGPPLLNGMSSLHRELEAKLARFKGGAGAVAKDALLFASGYQANLGWVTALVQEGDFLLYDELNHASLFDAIKLARADRKFTPLRFAHNDVADLERVLDRAAKRGGGGGGRQVFVAVEGVYSMDGDLAPLREIAALCRSRGAILAVDDAHGTGVMGERGAGTAEHFGVEDLVDIAMGTFSKAFGTTGGFIVARREVVDYLRFFSRSYMFSAHLPPATVAAVSEGIDVIESEPSLRRCLHENARYLQEGLNALGFAVTREAAILPVRIPAEVDLRLLAKRFHEEGIFLNSVEFPAVPKDEQRLRVSVMATHEREDLDEALRVFGALGREFGLIRAQ